MGARSENGGRGHGRLVCLITPVELLSLSCVRRRGRCLCLVLLLLMMMMLVLLWIRDDGGGGVKTEGEGAC